MNNINVGPCDFFSQHVLPNYWEWQKNPLDMRLAMNAVSDANNMAEYMWRLRGRTFQCVALYRDYLANTKCKEFAFVRDIADAHKHIELSRSSRNVTHNSQTKRLYRGVWPKGTWAKGFWAKGTWFEKEELVVTLDSGEQIPLSKILPQVIEMWKRLLDEL